MSLGFLLSLKTVPTVILDIISCFGSVHFCQGKLVQVTKLEKFKCGIGIKDIAYADGKLFIRQYIAENTILVCSLDCIKQYHFHSPSGFAHFIISHDREIYTLDSTLFYIDVFNLKGELKRSWPKFKHQVDKMWNYDEFHILIIFRHQICAHVFDRNGELLYVFGDQEHHRVESSHRHEILGNRSILIRFGDYYRLYINEKFVRVFPITFFKNYDLGSLAISPFGEIYHFSRDKTVTIVNIFELQDNDGKLVQIRDFKIPDRIGVPFLFLPDGSLFATSTAVFVDGFALYN